MTQCPDEHWDRTWANTAFLTAAGIPNPLPLSYAMNMHMNYPQCGNPNQDRDPTKTVVFGDGMWLTIFCGNLGPACTWAAYNVYIRLRHNGGANFACEDGHAKWYADSAIRNDKKMWGCPQYP